MTNRNYQKYWLKHLLLAALMVMQLTGCLPLEEDSPGLATDVVVGGSVGDGPVTGATVTIYSAAGDVLGSMVSDSSASFRSTIKVKGNQYPLRLVASGGVDLVTGSAPDFEMVSVMIRKADKQVNINPFSTLNVSVAEKLPGGLNNSNMATAQTYVLEKLGFGLDTTALSDPITSQVDDSNVANLVKASEALGEMIRRTRDLMAGTGTPVDGDSVLASLAADLVDGALDGQGAPGTSPLVTAVSNVVSGQVLIEALSNNLKVGGAIATAVIDQSIISTHAGVTGSQLTGGVRITQSMLDQLQASLAAVRVLDNSAAVANVATTVAGLTANVLPASIETVLPVSSADTLNNAVSFVQAASQADIDAINQAATTGGSTGPANNVPVIGGIPAGTVTANNSYAFQPAASDADGDSLSFSIVNKPSWAGFNTGTGRLSGTPADQHAGTYSNIVIRASDGTDTVSLPGFSVQVVPAPVVNTPPVISGSPTGSVFSNSGYAFQPAASDADGDSLSFSIVNKPSWAGFNTGTGRLSGTPADQHAGTYGNIVIRVSDDTDTVSLPGFSVQVVPAPVVNTPPVISGSPTGSVFSNSGYAFQPAASDADGDSLSFSIVNKPSWAGFNTGTGRLSGTPADQHAGTYSNIVIRVSDGTDTVSLSGFSIQVVPAPVVNTPPVINGSPGGLVTAGNAYLFQPSASDADGDSLNFSIVNKPSWASFDTGTGRLSGTPADQHAGTYSNIVIRVSDGTDTVSLAGFSVQVDASLGSFSLGWTAPATRADGSALSLADIDAYRVYYGPAQGNYTNSVTINNGSATSTVINNIQSGTWYVVMTTIDVNGQESAQSGAISKVAN